MRPAKPGCSGNFEPSLPWGLVVFLMQAQIPGTIAAGHYRPARNETHPTGKPVFPPLVSPLARYEAPRAQGSTGNVPLRYNIYIGKGRILVCSAVFEKVDTSVHGGYISSQRRLRSIQWPPGGSMSAVNSGNAPGLNSWTSACGPLACGRRTAAFLGITMGSTWRRRNRHKTGSAHSPCTCGHQGPLGISPGHPYRWLSLDIFSELVLGARAGYLHPRGQNNDFSCSGRNKGSMGLKRYDPGPPTGPFGWPHSRFGRAQHRKCMHTYAC